MAPVTKSDMRIILFASCASAGPGSAAMDLMRRSDMAPKMRAKKRANEGNAST